MRRNSGPESAHNMEKKFYSLPKKKSPSLFKDYGPGNSSTLDYCQVKPRRKKYNYASSEMLLNDESSSSDNMTRNRNNLMSEKRGRSLDRRGNLFADDPENQRKNRNRNLVKRQNATDYKTDSSANTPLYNTNSEDDNLKENFDQQKELKSRFQIGKRFLKGEIGIKSFNYYLLKEGLKSSKKNLLKQRSTPNALSEPQMKNISKSEENIYEEIFFDDKPEMPNENDEKIQFIDCELCVQKCANTSCEICHKQPPPPSSSIVDKPKKEAPQKPLPPTPNQSGNSSNTYKSAKSLDDNVDDLMLYSKQLPFR